MNSMLDDYHLGTLTDNEANFLTSLLSEKKTPSSGIAVQPLENQTLSPVVPHQSVDLFTAGSETIDRTNQHQQAPLYDEALQDNIEQLNLHPDVHIMRALSPRPHNSFPLENPPYSTNDVNLDEWTNYATYCGSEPQPELLNLLSNEENASLGRKYFTPQSAKPITNVSSHSLPIRTAGVTPPQPTMPVMGFFRIPSNKVAKTLAPRQTESPQIEVPEEDDEDEDMDEGEEYSKDDDEYVESEDELPPQKKAKALRRR